MIIFKISEITKRHYFIKQTKTTITNIKICINQARTTEEHRTIFFGVHVSYDIRIFG